MDISIFLAQIIGIYFLVVGISAITKPKEWQHVVKHLVEHEHTALAYIAAIFAFILGLILVLIHNVWGGDVTTTIVTIIGWLILIKGVTYFLLPSRIWVGWAQKFNNIKVYRIIGVVYIIVGAYLTYNGFGLGA